MAKFSAFGEYYNDDNVQSRKELNAAWALLKKITRSPARSINDVNLRELNYSDKGGRRELYAQGLFEFNKRKDFLLGFVSDIDISRPKPGFVYTAEKINFDLNDPLTRRFNNFRKAIISGDDKFIIEGPSAELDGGEGNDYFDLLVDYAKVRGGKGKDKYYFRPDREDKGILLIMDFSAENDVIQIDPVDASKLRTKAIGNNTLLEIGNNKEIIFKNRSLNINDIIVSFE